MGPWKRMLRRGDSRGCEPACAPGSHGRLPTTIHDPFRD
ncbi:hypothetical protein C7S13_6007 [Burkholderia cepacia]|nr:hypothetical protein [Burkholderia cepacia]